MHTTSIRMYYTTQGCTGLRQAFTFGRVGWWNIMQVRMLHRKPTNRIFQIWLWTHTGLKSICLRSYFFWGSLRFEQYPACDTEVSTCQSVFKFQEQLSVKLLDEKMFSKPEFRQICVKNVKMPCCSEFFHAFFAFQSQSTFIVSFIWHEMSLIKLQKG